MAPKQHQSDIVRSLIEAIQAERQKIQESYEAIAHYAERLRLETSEAQQRLIGRG